MTIDHAIEINETLSASSGCVTIAPGDYDLMTPIVVPPNVGYISAHGVTLAPRAKFAAGALVVASGTESTRLDACKISGLKINCRNRDIVGLQSEYTRHLHLDQVYVYNSLTTGLEIRNAWDFHVHRCRIWSCGSLNFEAVILGGETGRHGSKQGWFVDNIVEKFPGVGMLLHNQETVWVRGCKFHGMDQARSAKQRSLRGVTIEGCDGVRIESPAWICLDHDYEIEGSNDVEVTGAMNRLGNLNRLKP